MERRIHPRKILRQQLEGSTLGLRLSGGLCLRSGQFNVQHTGFRKFISICIAAMT